MKKKWLIFLGLLFVAGAALFFWNRDRNKVQLEVREVEVVRGDIETTILSTGIVQPQNRLEIKPPVSGRAESILVNSGDRVRKGQILAWMSSTERAALLDAARAKGPDEVARWEEYYKPTPVIAPIDGTIILRNVEPGQSFTNQEAVLVMSDRLSVKAQVDETDLAQIKLGQRAAVILDAYPDEELRAVVRQIAFDAVTVNNVTTYTVDVIPETTPAHMRSGMTANVRFHIESVENVLLVPAEAVRTQRGKSFVQLKGPKSSNTEREVSTGLSDGKQTEVRSGLKEGELVLITGIKPSAKGEQKVNPFAPARRQRAR